MESAVEFYETLDELKYPLLNRYTRPVPRMQRAVIGREKEEGVILSSFLRPEISNVILLGDAGSGKTTLVKNLALKDRSRFYLEVDVAKMTAGELDATQLAGTLKSLADEVELCTKEYDKEIVLFMDEIHQLAKISDMAFEALKPILAESGTRRLRILSATTYDEFDKYIAGNQALVERLQRVNLIQPDEDTVLAILEGMVKRYAPEQWGYDIVDDERVFDKSNLKLQHLFHMIYKYTNLYVPANSQPRKSIDVLDAMIGRSLYEDRDLDLELLSDVLLVSQGVRVNLKVDAGSIKKRLDEKVFQQSLATTAVENALQRCVAKLNDESRPMSCMLLTGSTGTGKTELCKQLAILLFNDKRSLIRIDMTEYSTDESVERFREELTRLVWERPFSIVLFDEIEKASPLVTKMLLPVLDDARLINKYNREVSFKNCYIMMTTNAASEVYKQVGDYSPTDTEAQIFELERLMPLIKSSIINTTKGGGFPPELLGRMDAIIPFQPLSEETFKKIVLLRQEDLRQKLWDTHQVSIAYNEKVADTVVFDRLISDTDNGGARSVIKEFDKFVVAPVAAFLNRYIAPDLDRNITLRVEIEGSTRYEHPDQLNSEAKVAVYCDDPIIKRQMELDRKKASEERLRALRQAEIEAEIKKKFEKKREA